MRYWAVRISNPNDGQVWVPNYNGIPGFSRLPFDPNLWTYSSLNAGASPMTPGGTNMSAQRFEIDCPTTFNHLPLANSYFKIYGVGLSEIAQSADLNGLNCAVYGGMSRGLPLANPSQIGLLSSGTVLQSFGNWINTEQTLNCYLTVAGSSPSSAQTTANPATAATIPVPASNAQPANLIFDWQPGTPLINAIVNTLSTAFPQYAIQGQISSSLVKTGAAATGFYSNIQTFCTDIWQKSLSLISGYAPSGSYGGVGISLRNNTFVVQDGTAPTTPRQLQIIDFVSQPTWAQPYAVQATVVLRGDLNVGDYVTLPALPGIVTPGSKSQYFNPAPGNNGYANAKSGSIFSGVFQIQGIRHVGDSRAGSATAWITTLDLLSVGNVAAGAPQSLPVLYAPTRGEQYAFYLPQ